MRPAMIRGYSDHAANERTFLAWVRTAIAVMAFGFLVEKFDLFLEVAAPSLAGRTLSLPGQKFGNIAGLALIVLGTAMVAIAARRHDLAHPQSVCLGKFFREHGAGGQRLEPPRPLFLRPDFRAADQIASLSIPTTLPPSSTTGSALMSCSIRSLIAEATSVSGFTVTTSRTITSIAFMVSSSTPRAFLDRAACQRCARPPKGARCAKPQNRLTNKT